MRAGAVVEDGVLGDELEGQHHDALEDEDRDGVVDDPSSPNWRSGAKEGSDGAEDPIVQVVEIVRQ